MSARFVQALRAPVDLASLVVFRIAFGLLAAIEAYRLVSKDQVLDLWGAPSVHLGWLEAAPWAGEPVLALYFLALALVGLAVAVGLRFRAACVVLAAGWGFSLGWCSTAFVGELALFALLAVLLAFTRAGRELSLDSWLRPAVRTSHAPAWPLLGLRLQLSLFLFAAGLALANADWLRGYPLRLWLPERNGMPLLGWVYESPGVAIGISWALVSTLLLGPVAVWVRRLRPLALAALSLALLWLSQVFALGMLPWLLLAGNLLFLPPGWPRRVFKWPEPRPDEGPAAQLPRAALGVVAAALAAQLWLLPLPWWSGGGYAWNAAGYAAPWRLVAVSKGGAVQLALRNPETGEKTLLDPAAELSWWQYRRVATHPALLARYARLVAERVARESGTRPEVRGLGLVTLNGREPQRLVDPEADLAALDGAPVPILPLEVPLEQQWIGQEAWPAPRDELVTHERTH